MSHANVGFAGLGAMGAPMAANLARAGRLRGVWNRTGEKALAFARAHDVESFETPAALARHCEMVLICVSADADVISVVAQMRPELRQGAVVIDCSTVSRTTARELAAQVRQTGAEFLDAPVSGGVEGARKGFLVMMVGGEARTLQRVRPVLEVLAERVEHMGPAGSGQAAKAVNQIMAAGINQAVTEALAFAQAQDLDTAKVIELLASGAAGNWFLQHRGPSMTRESFAPGFKVALHHKDLEICRAMAAELNTALPIVEMTLIHYRRLMDAGFGDEDISALFREKKKLF
jgi:3-hydroxyisobutyrate dehydrogenase